MRTRGLRYTHIYNHKKRKTEKKNVLRAAGFELSAKREYPGTSARAQRRTDNDG